MARKRAQPEHDEQVRLFNWARDNEEEYPELRNMFAIPNGGARHLFVAKKLKAEGVKAGVLDIFLATPRDQGMEKYNGLFIELKYGNNKPSKYQKEWITRLTRAGYQCEVCYGFEEARSVILEYLL